MRRVSMSIYDLAMSLDLETIDKATVDTPELFKNLLYLNQQQMEELENEFIIRTILKRFENFLQYILIG